MRVLPLAIGLIAALTGPVAPTGAQPAASASARYGPSSVMVFTTANIGRTYEKNSGKARNAMRRIRRNLNHVAGGHPRFVGWQEIDGNDPGPEMGILKHVFPVKTGWQRTLYRKKGNPRTPLLTPVVAHGAAKTYRRVVRGADGMKGASPIRWITVTRYGKQKLSLLNTHFMAGAFKGCACKKRKKLWRDLWRETKNQVAREHQAGFNVVVTADWNREAKRGGWSPAQVHAGARLVRKARFDNIVALPRSGWQVTKPRRKDGSFQQGSWRIGIDTHSAQWVKIRFHKR